MRALRLHDTKDLRVEDIPEPQCKDHQIKIKPAFVGICGSDLHEYLCPTHSPAPGNPHPLTDETRPVVVGHEFSGTVVEVGKSAKTDLKAGDKVVAMPTLVCGECEPCQQDLVNCCDKAGFLGISGSGGGISDFVCVSDQFCFRLPENVPLDIAALVEPMAVGWHACRLADVQEGSDILVMGGGPIGLAVIQSAKARGARTIICAEIAAERKRFAEVFGATYVLDPTETDVVARTKELCGGTGPRIAFDCAGVSASLMTAALAVKAHGTVMNVAVWEKEAPFNPNVLTFGEKTIRNTLGYDKKDFQEVIDAIGSEKLQPRQMITSRIAIDRVAEDGYRALIEEKNKHVKILVELAK